MQMQAQIKFRPLVLPKIKQDQIIYKLSDLEQISKLSNEKIHQILADNNIKPSYRNLDSGEYCYSRKSALKARKVIENAEYQEFKRKMYLKGYRTVKEITAELSGRMTANQVNKYLSILTPPIIRSGLNRDRFYRKEIIKELYDYYLNFGKANANKVVVQASNAQYMKDIDKVTTLYCFADKNGFALDKIKFLVRKLQIRPAFKYGQTEFFYKDSCEWLRLQIISHKVKI